MMFFRQILTVWTEFGYQMAIFRFIAVILVPWSDVILLFLCCQYY